MAEYIDRETFLKDIEERYCLPCKEDGKDYNGCMCRACWVDDMLGDVISEPAADVALVRHGRWTPLRINGHEMGVICSECNTTWDAESNFCPNCGAKMDKHNEPEN